jgi:transposase
MGRNVEEFDADEDEEMLERVAAIDVAKASGKVCVRLPGAKRRVTKVWDVGSTTNAIMALADELAEMGIERVVVESTSDYWRPFFYLLEARGLRVWLVNARDVKQVPGRPKTDKLDAVWLAKLNERGMLRASFVPPRDIRELRDYTRLRVELTRERSRHKQRIEKLLEDALIKLSTVATDIFGKSGRAMLDALVAGERDPEILADMALGKMRPKRPALVEALNGRFDDHHAFIARMLLDEIDTLTAKIDQLSARAEGLITKLPGATPPPPGTDPGDPDTPNNTAGLPVLDRLDEVPGIGPLAAHVIIAEIGLNMAQFPTPAHLVSWTKLSPRTIQSGPRTRGGKVGKGNPYLKGILGEVATAAAKTDTFLGERYRRLVRRTGKLKALVAVARSILVIIWHLLADPAARYVDLGPDHYDQRINKDRKTRNLVRQLQALGHQVTLNPAV